MNAPAFPRYDPAAEEQRMAAFLAANSWPFHVEPDLDERRAAEVAAGFGERCDAWWVEVDGETAGAVRIVHDEGDPDPWVDIRLAEGWRGRGLGRLAVAHAVAEVFRARPDVHRIEASARRDNVASRRTLRACGFVKEAVYRRAYEPYVGLPLDSIGYALLRRDWQDGTTTPVDWDEEP